jgi:hypothetical protein
MAVSQAYRDELNADTTFHPGGMIAWLYEVAGRAHIDNMMGSSIMDDDAFDVYLHNFILARPQEEEEDWTKHEIYVYQASEWFADTEIGDPNFPGPTVGDLYGVYLALSTATNPDEYRKLNETLFANGWYGVGATVESLENQGANEQAFASAVNSLVARGLSPIVQKEEDGYLVWDYSNLGTKPFTDTTADGEMRLTKDQIDSMADNAAQTVFGRAPSDQEKTMVLNLVRGLEASGVHRPGASDARAELRRGAPVEARTQDMSGVLRNFMSIVAGR